MDDYKSRVKGRIENYLQKELKKREPKRKNQKPEKDTERAVMAWLRKHGFSCSVVEAKAVYSQARGGYLRGQTEPGFPDVVGCDKYGAGVFIELKARGRRATASQKQIAFLEEKINLGAFACVTDCVEYLDDLYCTWVDLSSTDVIKAKTLLMNSLPKRRQKTSDELF